MQTKLTLRLEQDLIRRAKSFAKAHDKSVSQLVSDYFERLSEDQTEHRKTPLVRPLRGVLKGHDLDQADYVDYLRKKHQ